MTNIRPYPTLTIEQLRRDFECTPGDSFYEAFPEYPILGLDEEACLRILESSIKTAFFQRWHEWDRTVPVDEDKREKVMSLCHHRQIFWFEEDATRLLQNDQAIETRDILDSYTLELIASMMDYVLQTFDGASSEKCDEFELFIVKYWATQAGVISSTEDLYDIQNISEQNLYISLLLGISVTGALLTFFSFRLMVDYQNQFGAAMTLKDYQDISDQLISQILKIAAKSRDEGSVDIGHFIMTPDAIHFTRGVDGKLAFVFSPAGELKNIEQLKKDFPREFASGRPRMGCPVLHSKAADAEGQVRPFLYVYLQDYMELFIKNTFPQAPELVHDHSTRPNPSPSVNRG